MREYQFKKVNGSLYFGVILITLIPILSTKLTLDPQMNIQFIGLTTLLLCFGIYNSVTNKKIILRNRVVKYFISLYALSILYASITIFYSNNITDAIFNLATNILYFIVILAFLSFSNYKTLFQVISRASMALSIIILIPSIFQLIALIKVGQLIIPLNTYEIVSIFPHRNLFSEILLLTLPFSTYSLFSEKKKAWKYLGYCCFYLAVFMIIILSNRASWLGLIIISSISILTLLVTKQKNFRNKTSYFFIGKTLIVLAITFFVLTNYSDTNSLKHHSIDALDYTQGSTKDRIGLWSRTLKLIEEKPIFGHGLASWKINMLQFGNTGLASEDNTTFYQRPHNDFLWITSEQGLIGLALHLLLISIILFTLIKEILTQKKKIPLPPLLVILAVSLAYFIIATFSFPKERISHNIVLFASWGLYLNMLNSKPNNELKRVWSFKGLNPLMSIVLIAILILGIIRITSDIHTKKAILFKKASKHQSCISEIEKANSLFFRVDATSTPIHWYSGLSHFRLNDYTSAIHDFEIAYSTNPYHIYVLNDYASSLTKVNQHKKAIKLYKESIRISPNFLDAKLNLCAIYYKEKMYQEAFNLLKTSNIEEESNRYKKTVSTIIKKMIDIELTNTDTNTEFNQLFKLQQYNYTFYKHFLLNTIQFNLQFNEFDKQYRLFKKIH